MAGHAMMSLQAGRIADALDSASAAYFLAGREGDGQILTECRASARELIGRMESEARDARRAGDMEEALHVEAMVQGIKLSLGDR
jgi:hypothetical protein